VFLLLEIVTFSHRSCIASMTDHYPPFAVARAAGARDYALIRRIRRLQSNFAFAPSIENDGSSPRPDVLPTIENPAASRRSQIVRTAIASFLYTGYCGAPHLSIPSDASTMAMAGRSGVSASVRMARVRDRLISWHELKVWILRNALALATHAPLRPLQKTRTHVISICK